MAYQGLLQNLEQPSLGQRLAGAIQNTVPGLAEGFAQRSAYAQSQQQKNEALKSLGLPENIPDEFAMEILKQRGKPNKQMEKSQMLKTGLGTIKRMRGLIESAGGLFTSPYQTLSSAFGGEARAKRAELAQLGRSLIPLVAAGVPIRNQKEFEAYSKIITDPSSRQGDFEGALNALEDLFNRQLSGQEFEDLSSENESMNSLPTFNLSNPEHVKRRNQILKKTGGDRQKAEMILRKEFSL